MNRGATEAVVYCTVTVLSLALLSTTGTLSVRVPLFPSIASAPSGYTEGTLGVTALLATDTTPGMPLKSGRTVNVYVEPSETLTIARRCDPSTNVVEPPGFAVIV